MLCSTSHTPRFQSLSRDTGLSNSLKVWPIGPPKRMSFNRSVATLASPTWDTATFVHLFVTGFNRSVATLASPTTPHCTLAYVDPDGFNRSVATLASPTA